MTELLPCPFCGGEARIVNTERGWHLEQTHDDGCWLSDETDLEAAIGNWDEAEAIEAWNTRVKPPCGGNYCSMCGANRQTCYADDVTHRDCKYSVNRGWCERTCKSTTPDAAWCFVCSECGKSFPRNELHLAHNHGEINFCPNCGAKVVK